LAAKNGDYLEVLYACLVASLLEQWSSAISTFRYWYLCIRGLVDMAIYKYGSPVGVFIIVHRNNRWALCFEHEVLGMYNSPIAAADDVYTQSTGCCKWDMLDISSISDAPTDIYEWDKVI